MFVSGSLAGLESTRFAAKNAELDFGELAVNYGSMTTPHRLDFF